MSSDRYKKIIRSFTFASAALSGTLIYHLPNTFFLDKFQEIVQLYRNGKPCLVSNQIEDLNKTVMNDLKLCEEDQKKISLFTICGFKFFYGGSIWKNEFVGSFDKAIIGIPLNFNWETINKSTKEDILLNHYQIDWSSKAGKQLEDSLIVSDKAKKFALAQQLLYTSECEPLVKGSITSSLLLLTALYYDNIMKMKNLQTRPKFLRYSFFIAAAIFNLSLWFIGNDIYKCHLEKKADETLASLGPDYVQGGLEFYESVLNRNIAMRTLMGSDGESKYSLFGNEEMLFRQKHIPLATRRDFFKKLV